MTDNENTMSEQAIKDKDYTLAIMKLNAFGFFSQREKYELWDNNPKNVKYKDLEEVASDIEFLKDFINRQQKDKEKLQKNILKYEEIFVKQQEEIEKLKDLIDEQDIEIAKLYKQKEEAYKEFAERLKERAVLRCFDPMLGTKIVFSEGDLDNLVKEMVGK